MSYADYTTKQRRVTQAMPEQLTRDQFRRRPVEEDKPSEEADRLIERVETYQRLQPGWDSRGAAALSEDAARCVKAAIIALDDYYPEFVGSSLGVTDDVEICFRILGREVTVVVESGGWEWVVRGVDGQLSSGEFEFSDNPLRTDQTGDAAAALFEDMGLSLTQDVH